MADQSPTQRFNEATEIPKGLDELERDMQRTSAKFDDDLLAQLEQEAGSDDFRGAPPAWKPEPGDFIAGTVLSIFEAVGEYGSSNAMVVRTRTGEEKTVYCSSTVLKSAFERQVPNVGDLVAVKFVGEAEGQKSGRTYKDFTMKVVRQ